MIKKGFNVKILTGKDKNKTGEIIEVDRNNNRVKIKGEISGLTRANSGHFYFNLKDEEANLASIIWRGRASFLEIMPEEGLEVVALGKISTYMPRSNYNLSLIHI